MHAAVLAFAALVLLACHDAAAERPRAPGLIPLHAAPNGTDDGNSCLSADTPCTLQGAANAAMNDLDFADQLGHSCKIRLASGVYRPVAVAGTLVGAHVCK